MVLGQNPSVTILINHWFCKVGPSRIQRYPFSGLLLFLVGINWRFQPEFVLTKLDRFHNDNMQDPRVDFQRWRYQPRIHHTAASNKRSRRAGLAVKTHMAASGTSSAIMSLLMAFVCSHHVNEQFLLQWVSQYNIKRKTCFYDVQLILNCHRTKKQSKQYKTPIYFIVFIPEHS